MAGQLRNVNIRLVSNNAPHESSVGHAVRTITERRLCDWLTTHHIHHQHASEVCIVKASSKGSPALFVPDVMLTQKTSDGRGIILESVHSFSPKKGGMKTLIAFRKQYRDQFFIIAVGKRTTLESQPKTIADARVALENLDDLAKKLAKISG